MARHGRASRVRRGSSKPCDQCHHATNVAFLSGETPTRAGETPRETTAESPRDSSRDTAAQPALGRAPRDRPPSALPGPAQPLQCTAATDSERAAMDSERAAMDSERDSDRAAVAAAVAGGHVVNAGANDEGGSLHGSWRCCVTMKLASSLHGSASDLWRVRGRRGGRGRRWRRGPGGAWPTRRSPARPGAAPPWPPPPRTAPLPRRW